MVSLSKATPFASKKNHGQPVAELGWKEYIGKYLQGDCPLCTVLVGVKAGDTAKEFVRAIKRPYLGFIATRDS